MKRKKYLALFLALLLCCLSQPAGSDFGGFSGNSDYGGGSSGGGYSSGGYSSGGYSGGGMSLTPVFAATAFDSDDDWLLPVLIFVVLGIVFISVKNNKSRSRSSQPMGAAPLSETGAGQNLHPIDDYLSLDPNFNEAELRSRLSNLYVQMQDAWHNKNIEPLRPTMTDAFYSQMERQIDTLRKAGQTDYTERVAVLNVFFMGWRQAGGMDCLVVRLRTRITSWIQDDRTGKVIAGDKNREKFMEYEWELTRKSGVQTKPVEREQTRTCPHCGAPLGALGRCEYCGSDVTASDDDWAISSMKGISQQTA